MYRVEHDAPRRWRRTITALLIGGWITVGMAAVAHSEATSSGSASRRDRQVDNFFRGSLVATAFVPPTGEEIIGGASVGTVNRELRLDQFVDLGAATGDSTTVATVAFVPPIVGPPLFEPEPPDGPHGGGRRPQLFVVDSDAPSEDGGGGQMAPPSKPPCGGPECEGQR